MISASHNPFADNGIKLLAAGGRKLSDAEEETVESELESLLLKAGAAPPESTGPAPRSGDRLGRLHG